MNSKHFAKTLANLLFLAALFISAHSAEALVHPNSYAPIYAEWVIKIENIISLHRTVMTTLLDSYRNKLPNIALESSSIQMFQRKVMGLLPEDIQRSIGTTEWQDVFFLAPSRKGIYWVRFRDKRMLETFAQNKEVLIPVVELKFHFPTEASERLMEKAVSRTKRTYPLCFQDPSNQGISVLILPDIVNIQSLLEQTFKTQQDLLSD